MLDERAWVCVSDETLTGLCSGNRGALCPHDLFMSSCKIKTEAGSHRDAVDRPSVGLVMDAQMSDAGNTGEGCSYCWPKRLPPAVGWPQKANYKRCSSGVFNLLDNSDPKLPLSRTVPVSSLEML